MESMQRRKLGEELYSLHEYFRKQSTAANLSVQCYQETLQCLEVYIICSTALTYRIYIIHTFYIAVYLYIDMCDVGGGLVFWCNMLIFCL